MQLNLDPAELRPLIQAVVTETIAALNADSDRFGDKMALCEEEAARVIELPSHVLRDERLRGRITASQIVGRRIRYTRADLVNYLASRRFEAK